MWECKGGTDLIVPVLESAGDEMFERIEVVVVNVERPHEMNFKDRGARER